jgi:aspartate/methionine/tyrosine aminotransferase
LAFLALFGAGARVAMAAPGYPPYRHILTALGMESVAIESDEGETLQLSPRLIAKAGAIDGVVAASPANPTGAMLTRSDLLGLAEASREKQAAFVCDEIYHGLTYEAPAASALAIDPDAVVINSFSKYWAMTGWRVGWIVAPERLVKPIERLAQNLTIAPPTISQIAALGALEDTHEAEMRRARYGANRALILHTLPDLSLAPIARPDGAFYMLIDISADAADSLTFCHALLHEAGVALTPGLDFCEARGRAWVRLAYCQPRERVVEGLARLRHFLAR